MAKWGTCDFKQLRDLQTRMEKLEKAELQAFCESCTKELAARLLAKVIKRTPVDGGTLRRGWTAKSEADAQGGGAASAVSFAQSLNVTKMGDVYQVEIINPVNYASYVEFGHRTKDHKGWVEGRFMLTISEQELESQSDKVLERKLKKYLEGIFND